MTEKVWESESCSDDSDVPEVIKQTSDAAPPAKAKPEVNTKPEQVTGVTLGIPVGPGKWGQTFKIKFLFVRGVCLRFLQELTQEGCSFRETQNSQG